MGYQFTKSYYSYCFIPVYVPESCCVDGKSKILCQGDNDKYDGPPVFGPPNTRWRTHTDNPALHTEVSIKIMINMMDHQCLVLPILDGGHIQTTQHSIQK